MGRKNTIARGYHDMITMRKSLLPLLVLQSIIAAMAPFINIWFFARIVDLLDAISDKYILLINIATATLLNFAIFVIDSWIKRKNESGSDYLWAHEQNSISKKLYEISYHYLEDTEFMKKVDHHVDDVKTSMGIFSTLISINKALTTLFVKIGFSVILTLPFIKVMFYRTGSRFWESPWLALGLVIALIVFVAVFLPLAGVVNKKATRTRHLYLDIYRIFGYYSNMLSDYRNGKEIRLFKEQNLIKKHATAEMLEKGMKLEQQNGRMLAFSSGLMTLFMSVVGFSIYLLIGIKALAGLYSVGNIVLYIGGCFQFIMALPECVKLAGQLISIKPRIKLYYEILDTPDNKSVRDGTLGDQPNVIECRNISFRYSDKMPYAISNLNLTINKGERIAIVGENGSGKTTLIKLLSGLHRVTSGEILIDGKSIYAYNEENYQKLFSVVFQDFIIFSLPLGENIAVSNSVKTKKALDCLEKVGFGNRVSLDHNLYKDCDPNGIEISGGEAQMLALARALYKDAPIVILDEPTASLDPFAEAEIYSKFNEFSYNKSVIYISHRLSSCSFCDKIAVLDNGSLVQFGAHKDLLENTKGKYYELWNAQANYYI